MITHRKKIDDRFGGSKRLLVLTYNIYIFGEKSLEHPNINILLKIIPNLMKYVVFIPPDFKVLHFV